MSDENKCQWCVIAMDDGSIEVVEQTFHLECNAGSQIWFYHPNYYRKGRVRTLGHSTKAKAEFQVETVRAWEVRDIQRHIDKLTNRIKSDTERLAEAHKRMAKATQAKGQGQ